MNKNGIKLVAAASMLADHAGVLLFPRVAVLRWIGRLAFPLFAFCLGDGCQYTGNRTRYFLRIFLLGLACQIVFSAEELLHGSLQDSQALYLNILLTLSVAIGLCFAWLRLKEKPGPASAAIFTGGLILTLGADLLLRWLTGKTGILMQFDYGAAGAMLPLFAVFTREKYRQTALFSLGTVLFCLLRAGQDPMSLWALAALPVLWLYNGKPGKKWLQYPFYFFYPAHLAILYLIAQIRG